jgi:hypothetical protein
MRLGDGWGGSDGQAFFFGAWEKHRDRRKSFSGRLNPLPQ